VARIFLCHASEDKAQVREVYHRLRAIEPEGLVNQWLEIERNMQWLYLGAAIVAEVMATSVLKASEGFTRLIPSLVVLIGYSTAFYFLSLTLRTIPLGIAYAVWSAVGIALVSAIGWLLDKQSLDTPAIIGIGFIVTGVVMINGFSKSVSH
jgi:small multidrug resistance pump